MRDVALHLDLHRWAVRHSVHVRTFNSRKEEMKTKRSDYQPVPVQALREISDRFDKDILAIVTWDERHNMCHVTTYGRKAAHKAGAAELGDILAKAAGLSIEQVTHFEDFRTVTQSEWAEEKARLLKRIADLEARR